ncbi:MAG TPA: DUF47 family protein [Alphaproteobacteria bacterium]|nr:DUF47 family protein [Alphaproteobacteria bacterium]
MITRLIRAVMPKEAGFIADFQLHAGKILDTAGALHALIVDGADIKTQIAAIHRYESEADAITLRILQKIHKTFITPFDRREIQELITHMDDAVDLMEAVARDIELYEIKDFTPEMRAVAGHIMRCAELVLEAMPLLESINKEQARLRAIDEEIDKIESAADHAYFSGMKRARAELKSGAITDTAYRDCKEIYEMLETVVDHFNDVANVIEGIVLEQV